MSNISRMSRKAWKAELGRQIKAARELREMTQDELARRVKTNRGSVYLYETGKGNPQFRIVADIAAVLKADFTILGCRIAAEDRLRPAEVRSQEQLELAFDQDHSFLANVTIKPTKRSITITAHADFGIKRA